MATRPAGLARLRDERVAAAGDIGAGRYAVHVHAADRVDLQAAGDASARDGRGGGA